MVSKILGYTLSGLGLLGLVVTYSPVNKALGTIMPESYLFPATVVSSIILILGIFIISKSSSGKVQEVPIYHGKNVVGYRRIKQ